MFDFLKSREEQEKKQELEENIEQIREKVQNEEMQRMNQPREPPAQSAQPPENTPDQPNTSLNPDQISEQDPAAALADSGSGQQRNSQNTRQDRDTDQRERAATSAAPQSREERRQTTRQSKTTADTADSQLRQPSSNTADNQESTDESSKDTAKLTEDEVPEPPEVKDLDIPDIEKGPLFITVNKFKDALTTLSEMQQLAGNMEAQIGSLENTLAEDRETDEALRKLLDETAKDTEVIEDIVSP